MSNTGELRVGCCGIPASLARYAQTFSAVEIQKTFYQPPSLKTLERWRSQVPESFEFTLKAWQVITHQAGSPTYRRMREKLSEREWREVGAFRLSAPVMSAWRRTRDCALALDARLILFQCPARFGPTQENKANLKSFFREVRRGSCDREVDEKFIYLWEPRGEWEPEEVGELCAELGLVHVVDPFHQMSVTGGLGYFRLHGRSGYRYRFSDADLVQLLEMSRARAPCYILFNNISMLEDGRRFLRLVSRRLAPRRSRA